MIPLHADRAYRFVTEDVALHIPGEMLRDVRSKLAIVHSNRDEVKAKGDKTRKYARRTRIFQCLCGTDNKSGYMPTEKRQVGWEDVKCSFFAKMITTHDESDPDPQSEDPSLSISMKPSNVFPGP